MITKEKQEKLELLQKRLDEAFEKNLQDPKYRKSHCMELSEN